MGSTNYGNQTLVFDYRHPATSTSFNQIMYKLIPAGIYDGGELTKVDDSRVSVSPLKCFITDEDIEIGVRIVTEEAAVIAVDVDTPFIILRLDWLEQANNYMDILAVAEADINSDDLIVGKVEYTSNTIFLSEFDYTERDEIEVNTVLSETPFKVSPTNPPSEYVSIFTGSAVTENSYLNSVTGFAGPFSNTINGRIDIVYIDTDGSIGVFEGSDSATPSSPAYDGRYVIAEIQRGAGRDTIRGSEITSINPDARVGLLGGGGGAIDWKESVNDRVDFTTSEPSANVNERYINTVTGVSSNTGQTVTATYIYTWNGVNWTEEIPNEGTAVFVEDEDKVYIYDGSSWGLFDVNIDHNNVSNIQGGTTDEYYHFTQNQHSVLTSNYTISWEDTVTYSANEVVEYNGVLYRALGSSINHDPVSYLGVDWEIYPHNESGSKQGGTSGEYYHLTNNQHTILTSNYTDRWNSIATYAEDEIVEYNGVLYLALQANTNHDPETYIGIDWQKLTLGAEDWQDSVIDRLDLTTAEPSNPTLEDRYLNTVSGISSATAQSVTADYIYEWNGSGWDEVIPNSGTTVYVEDEKTFYVFDDSTWATLDTYLNSDLDHNTLSGLQGGDTNQYYHLNENDYNAYEGNHPVEWNQYTGYGINSIVSIQGNLYRALQPAQGLSDEPLSSDKWEKLIASNIDWQDSVLDRLNLTTSEPVSPTKYDRYINTATGTSSDTSQSVTEDYIYEWTGFRWVEIIPTIGTTVYVEDEQLFYVYDDSVWDTLNNYITTEHNSLSGLQGGNTKNDDEYYHLDEVDFLTYSNSYPMGFSTYSGYDVGDIVEYTGVLYKCISAITRSAIPQAFNASEWEELSLGGGAISEHTAGEDITATEVIALEINTGEAIIASKNNEAKIEVVGFAIESVTTGNTFDVQKAGLITGFTGLTPGLPCFLGDNGAVIQDDDLVGVGEYRVYLGIAKSATVIDANLGEATYNAISSTTSGESGSATTDYIASETISIGNIVAVNSSGQAIVADKRYSDHVAVVGAASESVTAGQTVTVTKLGELDQYSGLTAGSVCYLGDNGAVIDDEDLIDIDEYRVSVGIAKASTTVDISIGEITLNQLQEELAVRAFIGQIHGGGIYQESTDVMTLRPISLHVNDGIQDWWVEINEETDLSALANYPTGASSNWFYVLCDRYGNITIEETTNGTASQRPTDAFYQWGEYGGTGYDHVRKGYYHSSYSGKKIVGVIRKVSSGTWYVINQKSGEEETGENGNGRWERKGNIQTIYVNGGSISSSSGLFGGGVARTYPVPFTTCYGGSFSLDSSVNTQHGYAFQNSLTNTNTEIIGYVPTTTAYARTYAILTGKWHA